MEPLWPANADTARASVRMCVLGESVGRVLYQKRGGMQMTSGQERVVKVLLAFVMAVGAALAVFSELFPDEDGGGVSGQEWGVRPGK